VRELKGAGYGPTFAVEDGDVVCGQLCLGFDTHQKGGAAPGGYDLTREVFALEAEGESSFLQREKNFC